MQELALVALLAERAEEVLAHDRLVDALMAVRARAPERAPPSRHHGLAVSTVLAWDNEKGKIRHMDQKRHLG